MVEFLELYRPFLRGIEEKTFAPGVTVLNPDGELEFKPSELGWLVECAGVSNSPFAIIKQNFLGQSSSYSVYSVYAFSKVVTPNNAVPFTPNYDLVNNVYSVLYTPRPYKYFNKTAYIIIVAPSVNPITGLPIVTTTTIYGFSVDWIEITDLEEFKKSLKDIRKGDF